MSSGRETTQPTPVPTQLPATTILPTAYQWRSLLVPRSTLQQITLLTAFSWNPLLFLASTAMTAPQFLANIAW